MSRALLHGLCATIGLLAAVAPAAADPLDRVTGTESWKTAGPQSVETEWKDWFRARVMWRKARQDLRVQRRRNHQLAQLLRYSGKRGRINLNRARHIMRAPTPAPAPAPRRAAPDHADADAMLQHGKERRRPVKVYNGGRRGRQSADKTPEPPSWIKVPVERLDNSGQAIDDEGDRVLEDSTGKKR